jgi:hypothetical protein
VSASGGTPGEHPARNDVAGRPRAVEQLARVLLRIGHELGHRVGRDARVHDDDLRNRSQADDRVEIRARVVGEILEQRRIGGDDRGRAGEDRVAVRRRFRDVLGGDPADGTDAVVDDHRLLELGRHEVRERPDEVVGRRPGREGHDHADRPVRILLSVNRQRENQNC